MKLIVITLYIVFSSFYLLNEKVTLEASLTEVLIRLGDKTPLHYKYKTNDTTLIRQGFEIVTKGRTIAPNGKLSKRQSKYFVCTDCHNVLREDPDLTESNPDTRLIYAEEHDIPFLSGTTFFGMVNREHWYNDDYIKKYGALVVPAHDTLVNAVHLCTVECSQGRALEEWELKAVMAYFYSLEYKLKDLDLTSQELEQINKAQTPKEKKETLTLLKKHYLNYSPATFVNPIPVGKREMGKNGDPTTGEIIYKRSCLQCHAEGRVTNFVLSESTLDLKFLKNHLNEDSHKSVYTIVRKGTYALPGYRPYMPNYTLERLSRKQMEDLIAFIQKEGK